MVPTSGAYKRGGECLLTQFLLWCYWRRKSLSLVFERKQLNYRLYFLFVLLSANWCLQKPCSRNVPSVVNWHDSCHFCLRYFSAVYLNSLLLRPVARCGIAPNSCFVGKHLERRTAISSVFLGGKALASLVLPCPTTALVLIPASEFHWLYTQL